MTCTNAETLLTDLPTHYKATGTLPTFFGGPSVYFHVQCMKFWENDFLGERHLDYIFATLAAWGMHRMGDTHTKMPDFESFKASVLPHTALFKAKKTVEIQLVSREEYASHLDDLIPAFREIRASLSNARLVANTKVLHHILPRSVAPMDRQYTYRFFYHDPAKFFDKKGKKWRTIQLPTESSKQDALFKEISLEIWDIVHDPRFSRFNDQTTWRADFCRTVPKLVDNLIVSYIRSHVKQADEIAPGT